MRTDKTTKTLLIFLGILFLIIVVPFIVSYFYNPFEATNLVALYLAGAVTTVIAIIIIGIIVAMLHGLWIEIENYLD